MYIYIYIARYIYIYIYTGHSLPRMLFATTAWHNNDQAQSAATQYAPVEPLCHHYSFLRNIYIYIYLHTVYIYIYIYICSPNAVAIIRAHLYMHILLCIIDIKNYIYIYVIIPLYESPCLTPPLAFVSLPFGLK